MGAKGRAGQLGKQRGLEKLVASHVIPAGQTLPIPYAITQPRLTIVYCLFVCSGLSIGENDRTTPHAADPTAPENAPVQAVGSGFGVNDTNFAGDVVPVMPVPFVR